ncbi:ABC transporter permease [Halopiger goleimassiliensis]|uniref:ABC transporter permease n=1 Tax=Halopiger goleimassiliensis TaxID=1293048 RepID=UPI000677E227|nr:hypothetical protein [Halopiger goleimassiliensis]
MGRRTLATVLAVARAGFRQRVRSRRLLVVLALVAVVGYQLNVGTFALFYQDTVDGTTVDYLGEPTAPYVGLTTGLTGAMVLLLAGYYVLGRSLRYDRSTGFDELRASTPTGDRTYLLGKWLSHVGVVALLLTTLAGAAIVNHLLHGVGTTDPIWIVGPVLLIGVPVGCFVAGVTLVFQSIDRLRGTLGNGVYFFAAVTGMAIAPAAAAQETETIPLWLRFGDVIGLFAGGEMTIDALLEVAPSYDGIPIANYGAGATGGEEVTFVWNGGSFPGWFYANRLLLAVVGVGLAIVATVPYDRYATRTGSTGRTFGDRLARVRSVLPFVGAREDDVDLEATDPATVSLTPVSDRSAGGFGRLFLQEWRLLVRGHPWWWYAGAAVIAVVGLSGSAPPAAIGSSAAIWPLFCWSAMGHRTVAHRITPFIVSSKQPYRQLVAEWAAGAVLTAAFFGVALWPTVLESGVAGASVLAGAVAFVPSIAQAFGLWSRTRRVFELTYLVLWYAGPLNGAVALDFAGATGETAGTAIPFAFGAVGVLALAAALAHRWLQT